MIAQGSFRFCVDSISIPPSLSCLQAHSSSLSLSLRALCTLCAPHTRAHTHTAPPRTAPPRTAPRARHDTPRAQLSKTDNPLQFCLCHFFYGNICAVHMIFFAFPWAPTHSVHDWWTGYIVAESKLGIENSIGLALVVIFYESSRGILFYAVYGFAVALIIIHFMSLYFVNVAVSKYLKLRGLYTTSKIIAMFAYMCTYMQERISGQVQLDGGVLDDDELTDKQRELRATYRAAAEANAAAAAAVMTPHTSEHTGLTAGGGAGGMGMGMGAAGGAHAHASSEITHDEEEDGEEWDGEDEGAGGLGAAAAGQPLQVIAERVGEEGGGRKDGSVQHLHVSRPQSDAPPASAPAPSPFAPMASQSRLQAQVQPSTPTGAGAGSGAPRTMKPTMTISAKLVNSAAAASASAGAGPGPAQAQAQPGAPAPSAPPAPDVTSASASASTEMTTLGGAPPRTQKSEARRETVVFEHSEGD